MYRTKKLIAAFTAAALGTGGFTGLQALSRGAAAETVSQNKETVSQIETDQVLLLAGGEPCLVSDDVVGCTAGAIKDAWDTYWKDRAGTDIHGLDWSDQPASSSATLSD
jgi:hypothetical protein